MLSCSVCHRQFPFKTRRVKGVDIPLKKCDPCRAAVCERVKRYNKTPKGVANMKKTNGSDKGKERMNRFNHTTKGKERTARGRVSEKGQTRKAALLKEQRENPGKRLEQSLRDALARIWHQRMENAPILWRNTEFNDTDDLLDHLESLVPEGMNINVARKTLEIEHAIPTSAYDHNIEENVMRCHSKANIRLMSRKQNDEKGRKIIPSLCHGVGEGYWPIEWEGRVP